jgi:4'-phosphopantetheinyl transferase
MINPVNSWMATAVPEVHRGVRMWLIDLDAPDADGASLLSSDETARASRFVFDRHRRRFIAGRSALRRILAAEAGRAPETLAFAYSPAGKPSLSGTGVPALHFNLSHSDQWALVAVTHVGALGVDLEKARPLPDVLRLAQTAFSAAELEELRGVPASHQQDAFFAGWTRKEAYIKARGDHLGTLADFDVSLAADGPRLVRVNGAPSEPDRWALSSFVPVPGYAAALCVERPIFSSAGRT